MNRVLFLSLIKTAFVLLLILSGWIHLSPDEAQYWTWSRHLDFGYYSKPPGIAYQIAFGTAFFGATELGVRFGSLLIGFIMPFLIYKVAKAADLTEDESFWAAFIWCLTPLGFMGSFFAITDVGNIFFWTLALYFLLKEGVGTKFGLSIALGAIFKLPMYFIWLLTPFYERPNAKWPKAIGLSLLGLVPTLIWNIKNDFVTFRHVGATLPGGTSAVQSSGNFTSFVGGQIALFSPVFFILLLFCFLYTRKNEFPKKILFLGFSSILIILVGAFVALFTKMQGNWIDFAYPAACPFISYTALRYLKRGKDWIFYGGALSAFLILVSLFLPYKMSPYKHNLGWDQLGQVLEQIGYDPEGQFLFADSYQTTALLSFYAPGQKQAYFFNLKGIRNNQYSLWPSMADKEKHKEGLYVLIHNGNVNPDEIVKSLSHYFGGVLLKGDYPLYHNKRALVIQAFSFNGKTPESSKLY